MLADLPRMIVGVDYNINLLIYLDTGTATGRHGQMVNVTEIPTSLGQPYCLFVYLFI